MIWKIISKKKWKFHKKNYTILHYAAEKNSNEIFEILISKGADINAKDSLDQLRTMFSFIKMIYHKER